MDDFNLWWYLIAAVIYFLTRAKKKKKAQGPNPTSQQPRPNQSRPGTENIPPSRPKTFEELLEEITGQKEEVKPVEQEPVVIEPVKTRYEIEEEERAEQRRLEGERRIFADDESKRVYEDSIKQAEGADIKFERDEHFKQARLSKQPEVEEDEYTFADEIRDGLSSSEARKAVIYSEILNRRF